MNENMTLFVDVLTLAFHEARNVRHLVKEGKLPKDEFRLLIDGLPANRYEAWRVLQKLRHRALEAPSAAAAEALFRFQFGLSLEQLAELSADPSWAGTARGGNRWAEIDRAAVALRDALDNGQASTIATLAAALPQMNHNTGSIRSKLAGLDKFIEREKRQRDR
jgi:hypothetical protein